MLVENARVWASSTPCCSSRWLLPHKPPRPPDDTGSAPPLLPSPREFVFQAVHSDDIADAYWRVVDQGASGAFNIAADPVITPPLLGGFLGAKRVLHVPVPLVRALVGAA